MRPVDDDDRNGSEIDDTSTRTFIGDDVAKVISYDETLDPFSKSAEHYKDIDGVSTNLKRKIGRDIKKVYEGRDGARSRQIATREFDGYNIFGVVTPPYNLDYLAKLYTVAPAHYAAVNAKVANIVGLGFDIVNSNDAKDSLTDAQGDEDKTERITRKLNKVKKEVLAWLGDSNDEEEFEEVLKNFYIDYETTGNGYLEIGRTESGVVGYIGHIPSTTMRVRKDRDGYVQISNNKAKFFRHFGKDTPNPIDSSETNEVIHLKKYSPVDSYYGVPDIIAAMQAVTGNEFASRYNLDYFENKAVPKYVVVVKGTSVGSGVQRDLLDFFEGALKGKNHRTIIVPLPPDGPDGKTAFEMKPVETGNQDASFVNYHKINLQEILMAERVPMTKVGTAEGVNLAVARDSDKTFKEQVCRPAQRILEKKINKIIGEFTNLVKFKLNELTLTDEDTQSKIDERYLRMQTVVPNEIRTRWGWPGIEGGDKPVDLKAPQVDTSRGNRTRDANRSANSPDISGEARQPKGSGRAQD
jgi:PBSX family phage portal protein